MKSPEILAAISDHPFLAGMSEAHLGQLAEFAMQTHFAAGDDVFRTGDTANRFYLIQRGRVDLGSFAAADRAATVQVLGPGDALGWSWLFPPYEWQFDARALEPVDALFFYATPLRECCEAEPTLACDLMRRFNAVLLQRLQATRNELLARPAPQTAVHSS